MYLWVDRRVYTRAPGLEQGPRPRGNGCTTHRTHEDFGAPEGQLLGQDTQQRNTLVLNRFRQLPSESTLKHDSFPSSKEILIGLAWPGAATDRAHMIFFYAMFTLPLCGMCMFRLGLFYFHYGSYALPGVISSQMLLYLTEKLTQFDITI